MSLYTRPDNGQVIELDDYPPTANDPGTELQDGEYWQFWEVSHVKGRIRRRVEDGNRVYPPSKTLDKQFLSPGDALK